MIPTPLPPGQDDVRRVTSSLRPPRLAIGVPEYAKISELIALLSRLSATWGALDSTAVFPSAEWAPGSLWDRLIERVDPDHIFLQSTGESIREPLSLRYAPMSVVEIQDAFDEDAGYFVAEGATALGPLIQLWTFEGMEHRGEDFRPTLDNYEVTSGPDSFRLITAREWGRLSEADVERIRSLALRGTSIGPRGVDLERWPDAWVPLALFPRLVTDPRSVAAWNSSHLRTTFVTSNDVVGPPIIVVGNQTADVCLWLTLRSLRPSLGRSPVFWCPDELWESSAIRHDALTQAYLRAISESLELGDDPVHVTSRSLAAGALRERASSLHPFIPGAQAVLGDDELLALLPSRPYLALDTHPQTHYVQFSKGRALQAISPMLPVWLGKYVRTDVSLLGHHEIEGFLPPRHPAVEPLVETAQRDAKLLAQRPGADGTVCTVLDAGLPEHWPREEGVLPIHLEAIDAEHLLQRYAAFLNFTVTPSDAGYTLRTVIEKFGSVSEAASLLRQGTPLYRVAQVFLGKTQVPRGKCGDLLSRRIALVSRGIATALDMNVDDPRLEANMSKWISAGILHFGLVLRCPVCRGTDHYPWEDLRHDSAVCHRCRRDFHVTPDNSKGWEPAAQLDEMIYKALKADALEELALADWMRRQGSDPSLALGTQWALSRRNEVEIDVMGSVAGELWMGEAKSTDVLKADQLERQKALANAVQARRLIFATSRRRWTPAADALIRGLANDVRTEQTGVRVEAYVNLLDEEPDPLPL